MDAKAVNYGSPVIYNQPSTPSFTPARVVSPIQQRQPINPMNAFNNSFGSPVIYGQGGALGNQGRGNAGAWSIYGREGLTGSPVIYAGKGPTSKINPKNKNKKGSIDYNFPEETLAWRNRSRQNALDKYYASFLQSPEAESQPTVKTYSGGGGYGGWGGGGSYSGYSPSNYYDWYFSLLNWRI